MSQQTIVTGQITDPSGNPYKNCSYSVSFVNNTGSGTLPLISGSTFQTLLDGGSCDSTGSFSQPLFDNNQITPLGTQWKFSVCDQTGKTCFTYTTPICPAAGCITGTSISISAAISAVAPALGTPISPGIVGGSLIPSLNNTYNLGSPSFGWLNGYFTNLPSNMTLAGNNIFTGSNTFQSIQNIKVANVSTSGSDCGARINTQDTALGSTSGEIWVDQSCGTTWTTAVVLGQAHVLRFTQGGVYTIKGINVGIFGGIISDIPLASPSLNISSGLNTPVTLLQASGNNGNPWITLNQQSSVKDIIFNGNQVNNATGGPCLNIAGIRVQIERVATGNCPDAGLLIGNTGQNNQGGGSNLLYYWTISSGGIGITCSAANGCNAGSGIKCINTSDITMTGVQLENNSRYGWESSNCGTIRWLQGDDGGNALGGHIATCNVTLPNPTTAEYQIIGVNFGNNVGNDIFFQDFDVTNASYCGGGHSITGNVFRGLGVGGPDNTNDSIKIQDSAPGTNVGFNTFFSLNGTGCPGASCKPRFKNAVEMTETSPNRAQEATIWGNTFEGTLGTNDYITTANQALGINGSLGSYTGFSLIERNGAGSSCQNPANHDCLWADSVNHRWTMNNNGSGPTQIAGFSDNLGVFATGGTITPAKFASLTNCAVNSASPAACGAAPSGAVVIPTTTTTYTINTTAITANSVVIITPRTYIGNLPSSPTCVTPAITSEPVVSAIVAGTSFTINLASTTGQTCWNYWIIN